MSYLLQNMLPVVHLQVADRTQVAMSALSCSPVCQRPRQLPLYGGRVSCTTLITGATASASLGFNLLPPVFFFCFSFLIFGSSF